MGDNTLELATIEDLEMALATFEDCDAVTPRCNCKLVAATLRLVIAGRKNGWFNWAAIEAQYKHVEIADGAGFDVAEGFFRALAGGPA